MLITADYIYSPDQLLSGYVLEAEEKGKILDLRPLRPGEKAERFRGILCPGFVNAHCHLELSMLRGLIPEGLGMGSFVREVITRRKGFSPGQEEQALFDAMQELYFTGTVAVGDICNTSLTAALKRDFQELYLHNFVELMGLDESRAEEIMVRGKEIVEVFSPLPASLTLHAPYSVSPALRDRMLEKLPDLLSLHFMESEAELQLFREQDGPLLTFFREMGFPFHPFPATHPAQYLLDPLPSAQAMILVHNRMMDEDLLELLVEKFPHAWFCLCPRSNQYIHGSLPDAPMFARYEDRICLGTDSLASNHSLRMLDELFVLQQDFPDLSLHTLLKWATTNGAAALQQSDKFGSFTPGAVCGVNLIEGVDLNEQQLAPGCMVRKIC